MKRITLILLLGLIAGVGVHVGWYRAHLPADASDFESLLDEMRTTLQLDQEQFVRFHTLHETLQPQLAQLAVDVAKLQSEFATFENERRSDGEIDFLAYAGLIEKKRSVDRECAKSTQYLMLAALADMTREQRSRYLSLLSPVLARSGDQPFD